jgi:cytochrome c oxidase subunit IV
MRWETKLKLIMAILTPPIVIGCYMLLAGVYLYSFAVMVIERTKGLYHS